MDIKSLLFLNRLYRSGRLLVEETGVPECLSQMLVNSTIPFDDKCKRIVPQYIKSRKKNKA
jgi:hypothetical protein